MRFDLDPPHGITGFPISMPADELIRAARELGRVQVESPGSAEFHSMKVLVLNPQYEIVFTARTARH